MCASIDLQGSSYLKQMEGWAARNAQRIDASRKLTPAPLAFSNISFPPSVSFPLFEAKAAMAVPSKYYQPLSVDGIAQRNDWAHDFCRSIAFMGDELLLLSQAVAKRQDGESFLHYLAVKFNKNEFSFDDLGNGKYQIGVHDIRKEGTDILTSSPSSHAFSFSFAHNPTKMATMSATSFRASALAGSVYGQHGGLAQQAEESVITVAHLAPHPYLLSEHLHFGYKARHDFINDVSALLAGYLKK